MIQILHHPLSAFCRRIKIFAIEKNIELNWQYIALEKQANKQADFLALNPYGMVPCLKENGFVLYESIAILDYLESNYSSPALWPSEPKTKAQVLMHMKLCDVKFASPVGNTLYAKRFLPEDQWDAVAIKQLEKDVQTHFSCLEPTLVNQAYLVGDSYTLADLCYVPFLDLLHLIEIDYPNYIQDWMGRLLERTSSIETKLER